MSLTIALANAGSGLAAASRAIQVASGNIANAQTPGHAVRSLQLTAASLGGSGGGVRVAGVTRQVDPALTELLRAAGGARAQADTRLAFWAAVEEAVGLPDAPGSLTDALARFTTTLISAADRPDLDSRLAAIEAAARGLADRLNELGREVQTRRLAADAAIARDATALDAGLARLHALNSEIASLRAGGLPALELEDQRDGLLARLSEIVPLKAHTRPDGQMLVYTAGGLVLLDRQPARIGFQPVPGMTAVMTLHGGQLSGLTVNGRAVDTGPGGPLAGGRLAAEFGLRDIEGPAVQAALDQLAQSLIARFQDPATDPSALPGAAGLFTDDGGPMGPAPDPGLAGRITLNPLVQPDAGGALARLRDGLGAAPGPVGDASQIRRWLAALDRPVAIAPGAPQRSFGAEVDATLSLIGQSRQAAGDRAAYAEGIETALRDREREAGVDVDAEMRRLVAIEAAYAANARVIRIADEMLRRLLEI
jgi:flagellar hook-associated protein 1 FlgK